MSNQTENARTLPKSQGQHIAPPSKPSSGDDLSHVGRYRVERLLGEGGFGRVYLARDEQLQRLVAVKVPHPHLIASPQDANAYLAEARIAAGLDHPNIVPVFDVGSASRFPCFIVSKFIEGRTLAAAIRHERPTPRAAGVLVAAVADALQHAHQRSVIHRDIKPSNILLDAAGRPFVADFGLALRDQDVDHSPRYAGTPSYMSPEQARGEGHRVDGRTDIFSLGVVFYELLTGRLPFHSDSRARLLEQIAVHEPRPPRQWDDAIPKELERICLKALAKRVTERYTTAQELAHELRDFLTNVFDKEESGPAVQQGVAARVGASPTTCSVPISSDEPAVKVVPKGLRSFDSHDADFFLGLLPGPRDRDGLPDSIRFWKTRIEETNPDNTFAIGLIYGPSGCGKSSLVRAGLLPRLSSHVIPIYVEATAEETETRLLNSLGRLCPDVPTHLGLKMAIAELRRGQCLPAGKKILLVLDQFEQWLHSKRAEQSTELAQALRQCSASRVQCIVMVRDDFWMAVTRFLQALEIELRSDLNFASIDLFDPRHAMKILMAFGRAHQALPEHADALTNDQDKFLDQAIAGLAQDGRVICVRLALFAEMLKGRPWTPATLRKFGGMEGMGITFLEDAFAAVTAPPQQRMHQRAAQAVLKALLPESGTDIKGHLRSHQELQAALGYAARPKEFEALLHILDGELRLITPTDPEEANNEAGQPQPSAGARYYQLTHDYLVHPLREWLARKQKKTWRGRAEILLAEYSFLWNARPAWRYVRRYLPGLFEWIYILIFTRRSRWTDPQRRMMRRACIVNLVIVVFVYIPGILILCCFSFIAWILTRSLASH
jgi:serine/threonine protein kinase